MSALSLTIFGEPASKANSRQLVTNPRTGKAMFIKSAKARKYVRDVEHQVPVHKPLLLGPLIARITIYYATERPDLDESLILDALQKRVYLNDRQVREKHVYHAIDRAMPRAEIEIEPMAPELFAQGRAVA